MKKVLITVLVTITLIVSFYIFNLIKSKNNEIDRLRNQTVDVIIEEVIVIDSTLYKGSVQIIDKLVAENSTLDKELKNSKSEIKHLNNLIVTYRNQIEDLTTTPDEIDTTRRNFSFADEIRKLEGYFFVTPPYTITITVDEIKIDLTVYHTQDKDGKWSTYIDTKSPKIKINSVRAFTTENPEPLFRTDLLLVANTRDGFGVGVNFTYDRFNLTSAYVNDIFIMGLNYRIMSLNLR